MRLWADVYNAAGQKLGDGPVNLISASVTRALDGAGTLTLAVSGADPRALALIQNERRVKIYVYQFGQTRLLGSGILRQLSARGSETAWERTARGVDDFDELKRVNTLLNRKYNNQAVGTVAASLAALAGWTVTADAGLGTISAVFDGDSVLKALQFLAESQGLHIRLGSGAQEVELGAFGQSAGLRLVQAVHGDAELNTNDNIALIESLTINQNSEAVANWIIPIGAEEGTAALKLQYSTRTTPYPIQTLTGPDGKTIYYLSHAASIAEYGTIQKVTLFKQIKPISNASTDRRNAANALYDAAAAWLDRYSVRQDSYKITCRKGRRTIRPGDKVRVVYKGLLYRDGALITYVDIDEDFWVIKASENASELGITLSLDISSVDRWEQDSAQIVVGALEAIELRNLKVQPYPTKSTFVRYEELDTTHPVIMPLKLTDATLNPVRCVLTLKTRPLRSTAKAAKSGGGTTSSSGGAYSSTLLSSLYEDWNGGVPVVTGPAYQNTTSLEMHNHVVGDHRHKVTINIPAHTHTVPDHTHGIDYGIFDDTEHPQNLQLWINGIDQTALYSGPWAPSSAPVTDSHTRWIEDKKRIEQAAFWLLNRLAHIPLAGGVMQMARWLLSPWLLWIMSIVLGHGEINIPYQENGSISDRTGMKLYDGDDGGILHLEGVLIHGPGLSEAVQGDCPTRIVQIQNCRALVVDGRANHSDAIQIYGNCRELRLHRDLAASGIVPQVR